VTNLEKQVEVFDIDADSADWQPYFSFVEALREKIVRAEPIGKPSVLYVVLLCAVSPNRDSRVPQIE